MSSVVFLGVVHFSVCLSLLWDLGQILWMQDCFPLLRSTDFLFHSSLFLYHSLFLTNGSLSPCKNGFLRKACVCSPHTVCVCVCVCALISYDTTTCALSRKSVRTSRFLPWRFDSHIVWYKYQKYHMEITYAAYCNTHFVLLLCTVFQKMLCM